MTFMRKILDALTIESPKAMTDSADVDYPSENSSPTKEPIKGSIINNTGKSISYPKVTDAFLWECNSVAESRNIEKNDDYLKQQRNFVVENSEYDNIGLDDTPEILQNNITSHTVLGEFDLNIEKILENWEVYHAIREIISNALDEQVLTGTQEIAIYQASDNWWHVRDYGRGLNYHHLTQNENEEKLSNDKLIGRFGVGLKDALATLYRHNVKVKIRSKYGIITLKNAAKTGFEDIVTLHAEIFPPDDSSLVGTDFCFYGCDASDVEKAKSLFLKFTENTVLEETKYGQVLTNNDTEKNIYINGVKVAGEPNFLFSYNITSLTLQIKKALNRERTNVGRSAYTARIKDILKECSSQTVINKLIYDLQEFSSGNRHDELTWNDIALHASVQLSAINTSTTFVTTSDLQQTPSLIDDMERNGFSPIVIPDNLLSKIADYNAINKRPLITAEQYVLNEKAHMNPTIIDPTSLSFSEQEVYYKTKLLLGLIGGKPQNVNEIHIIDSFSNSECFNGTLGLWIKESGQILIKRTELRSLSAYAGTLLHECAHAISGADDVSRDFELELSSMLGSLAAKVVIGK